VGVSGLAPDYARPPVDLHYCSEQLFRGIALRFDGFWFGFLLSL